MAAEARALQQPDAPENSHAPPVLANSEPTRPTYRSLTPVKNCKLVKNLVMKISSLIKNGKKLMRWRGVTFWLQYRMCCNISIKLCCLLLRFGDQSRSAKQTAMRDLMNTKMVEGIPVRDHVLKMISLLNELEILGAEIDNDSQVEMILQSLPDSFQQFHLNYNMNKMSLSLAQLLNELQVAETIIGKQAPPMALNIEKGSTSKSKGGQKKKKAQKGKAVAPSFGGVKKPKDKCFHCKMSGHWKVHCPVFLAKQKNKPGVLRNAQAD